MLVEYQKQNGEPGVKVSSIMALEEDEPEPKPSGDPIGFEISGTRCQIPSDVPQFVRNMIEKSSEWAGTVASSAADSKLNRDRDFNEFANELAGRVAAGK